MAYAGVNYVEDEGLMGFAARIAEVFRAFGTQSKNFEVFVL